MGVSYKKKCDNIVYMSEYGKIAYKSATVGALAGVVGSLTNHIINKNDVENDPRGNAVNRLMAKMVNAGTAGVLQGIIYIAVDQGDFTAPNFMDNLLWFGANNALLYNPVKNVNRTADENGLIQGLSSELFGYSNNISVVNGVALGIETGLVSAAADIIDEHGDHVLRAWRHPYSAINGMSY